VIATTSPLTVAAKTPAWAGLVWTLIRTDFKARYHGTLSGFVWALLKPTAMFLVLVGVFSFIFEGQPNYRLNLILGLFLWDYFADGTKVGMISLSAKGFLVAKAQFPRWIVIVTSIANALITILVFASVFSIYLVVAGQHPGLRALLAFAGYLCALTAIVIGISLASSVLYLRFRDLNQIWDMAIQAGFFLSPVIYPLGVIPERYHAALYLWPPTPIIEFSRSALIGGVMPTATGHACLALMAVAIVAIGALIYARYAPRAAEYV